MNRFVYVFFFSFPKRILFKVNTPCMYAAPNHHINRKTNPFFSEPRTLHTCVKKKDQLVYEIVKKKREKNLLDYAHAHVLSKVNIIALTARPIMPTL